MQVLCIADVACTLYSKVFPTPSIALLLKYLFLVQFMLLKYASALEQTETEH